MTDRDPGNNPKDAQEEAKALQPNRDEAGGDSDNPLEREFESTNERDLETLERQHDPLTDPEDNAKVNRVVPDAASRSVAARPVVVRTPPTHSVEARSYLVSPATLRNLFVGSSVAGLLLIVAILTLASSKDQARYTPADETQYQRTLQEATQAISATGVNEGGNTARIPIEEAITVVAAQGLEAVNTALAVPPEDGAAATTPQEEAVQEEAVQEGAAQAEPQAPAGGAGVAVAAAGQAVFEANCASCHQATGQGLPGAFPTLIGHVPTLYNADRVYLVNLLLYGLQGEIEVEGQPYNGLMPAWGQLSDDDIAGILNYISTAWDNGGALGDFKPYEAGEIASAREAALSAEEVYALRQELELGGE